MGKRSLLALALAGLIGGLAVATTSVLQAAPTADDEGPKRLVVFELFNRSQSGG